jgi:hypothetical protein
MFGGKYKEYENYIGEQQRSSDLMTKQLDEERIKRIDLQNQFGQMSSFPQVKEQNIIEYQLDLKEELDRIHHLLSGHHLGVNEESNEVWLEPQDDRLKIFSEYGVKQIMNIISFYINRNTLLSNYDEKTIMWKVRDFAIELSDLIFNRYEYFFYYPTPEELYETYAPIASQNNVKVTERELYYKCVQWSKEELQNKIRHYPMICLELIDSIHSTFLRALRGETMKSLRTITHISQSVNSGMQPQMQKPFSMVRPSTWRNT